MPKLQHDTLVELFRNRGELAPSLLQHCAGLVLPYVHADQGSIDLSQVTPTEYRADAVTILRDANHRISAAIIVEVQLRVDRRKERSWPVYVTALHAKLGCPVILFVIVPTQKIGAWARSAIPIGHPGFVLNPIVQEIGDVPPISDLPEIATLPELAVLSAIAHPKLPFIKAALKVISILPEEQTRLYSGVLAAVLPKPRPGQELSMFHSRALRAFVDKYPTPWYASGRREGRKQGRKLGIEKGMRKAALVVFEARFQRVTDHQRARLAEVRGEQTLKELLFAFEKAKTAAEARAAITIARKRSIREVASVSAANRSARSRPRRAGV